MTASSPKRATWRQWCGLGAMTLALFMMTTDLTVLFIAQPAIAADLHPTATQALWIVHISEFLAASLVITMGRLGDRVGRRRLLILGTGVYGAASMMAAFAPNPEVLITARSLMGIGAATVTPCAMALLRIMFTDSRQFSFAFATLAMALSGGAALGPPLGGLLLEHFWWGSVFLINVPAAIVLLASAPWTLPASRDPGTPRLDAVSIVLSVVAVMGVVYGLQQAADSGPKPVHVVAIGLGLISGWWFIRRQRRLTSPLLDLSLLAPRQTRIALLAVVLATGAFASPQILIGPWLQLAASLSSLQTGMALLIPAAIAIPATYAAPWLKHRLRMPRATITALAIATLGNVTAIAALTVSPGAPALAVFILGLSLVSFTVTAMTLLSERFITSAPLQRTGSMTAVQDLTTGLGAAGGVAVMGTLGALIFRATLTLPPRLDTSDAQTARESPGAAADIAVGIDQPDQAEFLTAIGDSMTLGLQTSLMIAAVGSITAMALVLSLSKHDSHKQ